MALLVPKRGDVLPIPDSIAIVKGSVDATKQVRIEADGLTTGTTRVLTMPDADITPDDQSVSRAPSGTAGGGLSGTYPSPTVDKIEGVDVSSTPPTIGQVLTATSGTAANWQTGGGGVPDPFTPPDGTWNVIGKISVRASGGAANSEQFGESAIAATINSTAVGFNATASGGEDTTALGSSAGATGTNATALGANASATKTNSLAAGRSALATGTNATALGAISLASMARSTAVGDLAQATQADTLAVGQASSASGSNSTALGAGALAQNTSSTAVGQLAQAKNSQSTALGAGAFVDANEGTALGRGAVVTEVGGTAVGKFSKVQNGHTNAVAIGITSLSTAAQRTTIGRVGGIAVQKQELQLSSGLILARTGTAADISSAGESIIGVTDTSVPRTVTLQTADLVDGRTIAIKDESGAAGTNNITIATQAAETIDGAATLVVSTNFGSARLYSDGVNWFTL